MDRDIGDCLEEYLGGILEYNAGKSGFEYVSKKRMKQLKYRYKNRSQLKKLVKSFHEEGINLMAINLDKKYEYLELLSNVLPSAAEYYSLTNQFDFEIREEEMDGKYLTSLLFEKEHIPEIRMLFDFYANFLRYPQLFPEFAGPLLREYFDPFLQLEKNDFGLIDLDENEVGRLTDILVDRDVRVNRLIEKQKVVIHGYYRVYNDEDEYSGDGYLMHRGEDEEICLETDIFKEDVEKIIQDLSLDVRTESHSEKDYYVTRLIAKIGHAGQLVTLVDTHINYINSPPEL
ncbi:hypothetical protein HN865_01350 [Candidatus Woesearchaeota archaeon]|jgi:hypothetical protein|nr:hypothetical protein [Candidatus Woesearchaeota archaeon]